MPGLLLDLGRGLPLAAGGAALAGRVHRGRLALVLALAARGRLGRRGGVGLRGGLRGLRLGGDGDRRDGLGQVARLLAALVLLRVQGLRGLARRDPRLLELLVLGPAHARRPAQVGRQGVGRAAATTLLLHDGHRGGERRVVDADDVLVDLRDLGHVGVRVGEQAVQDVEGLVLRQHAGRSDKGRGGGGGVGGHCVFDSSL